MFRCVSENVYVPIVNELLNKYWESCWLMTDPAGGRNDQRDHRAKKESHLAYNMQATMSFLLGFHSLSTAYVISQWNRKKVPGRNSHLFFQMYWLVIQKHRYYSQASIMPYICIATKLLMIHQSIEPAATSSGARHPTTRQIMVARSRHSSLLSSHHGSNALSHDTSQDLWQ